MSVRWGIHNCNRKRVDFSQPREKPKVNIHGKKVFLGVCVWRLDTESVIIYKLFKFSVNVNATHLRKQLHKWNTNPYEVWIYTGHTELDWMILDHSSFSTICRYCHENVIMELSWDTLFHPAYSPLLDPTDLYFFLLLQYTIACQYFHTALMIL